MKILPARPFTFERGKRAVLLLHGFTGNSSDVRMLGRFLEKQGYTCHAPVYRGHGLPPEELLKYRPSDWWEDALRAYHELRDLGYEEIAVAGLSLGGLFTLKLSSEVPVKGIVPMCAPMGFRNEDSLYHGVLAFARGYKQKEKKSKEQIDAEMIDFNSEKLRQILAENQQLIKEIRASLDMIYAPAFVVQARMDEMIDIESANTIYNEISSPEKELKWYEESHHVITLDKEKEQLHEDILQFLNRLNWTE